MNEEQKSVLGHAFFDGKRLQYEGDGDTDWIDWYHPYCPDFLEGNWRIKPDEPKTEIWCSFRSETGTVFTTVKASKDYETMLRSGYFTHTPSQDKEVTLP